MLGGGGSVTIGPFICLYVWALVTRVGKIVVVVRSSGCRCLGDRALLQLHAMTVARASGNTWWDSQFVSGSVVNCRTFICEVLWK